MACNLEQQLKFVILEVVIFFMQLKPISNFWRKVNFPLIHFKEDSLYFRVITLRLACNLEQKFEVFIFMVDGVQLWEVFILVAVFKEVSIYSGIFRKFVWLAIWIIKLRFFIFVVHSVKLFEVLILAGFYLTSYFFYFLEIKFKGFFTYLLAKLLEPYFFTL